MASPHKENPNQMSKNITIENCIIKGRYYRKETFVESTLVCGGYGMSHVRVINCRSEGLPRLVLSKDAHNWIVRDCTANGSSDSTIYLKGHSHTVESNTIYNAGKDGIKIRPMKSLGPTGYSIIRGNTVVNYGLIKSDAGGAFNIEGEGVILDSNTAVITVNGVVEHILSGFNIKKKDCVLVNNKAISNDWNNQPRVAYKIKEEAASSLKMDDTNLTIEML